MVRVSREVYQTLIKSTQEVMSLVGTLPGTFKKTLLTGHINYKTWLYYFEYFCRTYHLNNYITDGFSFYEFDDDILDIERQRLGETYDIIIARYIDQSVSDEVLRDTGLYHGRAMYEQLAARFGNISIMDSALILKANIHSIQTIEEMDNIFTNIIGDINPVDLGGLMLLLNLNEQYWANIIIKHQLGTPFTVNKVKGYCKSLAIPLPDKVSFMGLAAGGSDAALFSGGKSNVTCSFCKKNGHLKKNCFKLRKLKAKENNGATNSDSNKGETAAYSNDEEFQAFSAFALGPPILDTASLDTASLDTGSSDTVFSSLDTGLGSLDTGSLDSNCEVSNYATDADFNSSVSFAGFVGQKDIIFHLDSGSTRHLSCDKSLFESLDYTNKSQIVCANQGLLAVEGTGNIKLTLKDGNSINLSNVCYTPDSAVNLFSISAAVKNKLSFGFNSSGSFIINCEFDFKSGGFTFLNGISNNNLFSISSTNSSDSNTAGRAFLAKTHARHHQLQ